MRMDEEALAYLPPDLPRLTDAASEALVIEGGHRCRFISAGHVRTPLTQVTGTGQFQVTVTGQ